MAGMPLFAHAGREKLTRSAGGGQRAGGAEELRSNRRLLVLLGPDDPEGGEALNYTSCTRAALGLH